MPRPTDPFEIRWRCPKRFRTKRGVVYGPAHRPYVRQPKMRVRVAGQAQRLSGDEADALYNYRRRKLDEWLDGLGLLEHVDAMPEPQAAAFRRYAGRCYAATWPHYLHTLQFGRDETGEWLATCRWPAQQRLKWTPPPQDLEEYRS